MARRVRGDSNLPIGQFLRLSDGKMKKRTSVSSWSVGR